MAVMLKDSEKPNICGGSAHFSSLFGESTPNSVLFFLSTARYSVYIHIPSSKQFSSSFCGYSTGFSTVEFSSDFLTLITWS